MDWPSGEKERHQHSGEAHTEDKPDTTSIEQRLKTRERQVRAMLDQTFNFVGLLNLDGVLIDANRSALDFAGMQPSDAIGKFFWETSWWIHDPVQQNRLREGIKRAAAGEVITFEPSHPGPDGETHYFESSLKPIKDEDGRVVGIIAEGRDVTERKNAERWLRQSEERYRLLVETTRDWIWETDVHGVYTYVSPRCRELLGYDPDELIGRSWFDFMSPDEAARVARFFKDRADDQSSITNLEKTYRHKNGAPVILETNGEPIFDDSTNFIGYRGIDRDITERRASEEETRKLSLALKHSGELINMATLDGQMTFINEAGANMLGIDPEEVTQTRILDVISGHLVDFVQNELLPVLMRGESWQGELQYKNLKTGKLTDVHALTFTVPDPKTDKPLFLANVSRDITELKRAERERKALEARFQQVQKLESLGVLAGGIAHEFNNLLMGILGNTDLALTRVQKGTPFEKYFDRIRKAAARATTLCRQMLAYSGQGSFMVEDIDVGTTVEGMSYMLDTVVSKKADLSYQVDPNAPLVKADAKQLQQLILNLVTNASEALPISGGSIVLSIKTTECDREQLAQTFIDEALPGGTYVVLEVADNGHGMDSETVQKIFDPFFSTKFAGRGLGLSAVLGIIRGHKGSIEVISEPDKGTSIRVYLPAIVKETFAAVTPQNAHQIVQGNGTILLVDDEEIIRATVSELLEGSGFNVMTAPDGHKALKLFEQHLAEIDAVLLDLTMPVMDGKETFRQLRLISEDIPVFFCSGHNEEVLGDQFSNDALIGFIQKPFRLNVVLDKLAEVMSRHQISS